MTNFAKVYYSWEQTAASIDSWENAIKNYMTGDLQALNTDTVRKDIPVSSTVNGVQIWSVTQADEINEFLTTFFKLYPTATAKELSYYVNEGVLKPIGKDYVFSELVNPIYNRSDSQVTVSVAVKYLDQQTKATQVSQFDLVLEKSGSTWKIIN